MRLKVILPAALLCAAASIPSLPAQAASTFPSAGPCPSYGGVQICSGEVPSFDGSLLDVDVTLPTRDTGDRHPLIVMLHGFANNKHEWESLTDEGDNADKWHWNNHWFAEHGFYVLTYTARGFFDPGTTGGYQPETPGGTSYTPGNGTIHLKSRDFEIKDTQWLAALTAAAYPDMDPNRVAVTGGSYGGGESWLQAAQADWTFAHSLRPDLPVLHLQVAVPKYPWTDLAYSLAPNGHPGPYDGSIYSSSQGAPGGPPPTPDTQGNPLGVVKYTYAAGFFLEGDVYGVFETAPEPIVAWFQRVIGQGDNPPYDEGRTDSDIIPQVRAGLTEERSSYYQDDDGWTQQRDNREVAIFSISGWTDFLFPPVEAFRQFKYLKSLDRMWPVELAIADVGHPPAQNKSSQWQHLNDQAWQFLKSQVNGSHRQETTVSSMPTICPQSGDSNLDATQRLTGRTPEELSKGALTVSYGSGGTIGNWHVPFSSPLGDVLDPDNHVVDPIFGAANRNTCRVSTNIPVMTQLIRYTGVSEALPLPRTYIGLGHVDIDTYTLTAKTATLNARLWDVSPDGTQLLVTRGTYRIDPPGYDVPGQPLQIPLFGNQWTLEAGHQIRLDLTLVDSPSFLPSNQPGTLLFSAPRLVLPTREATDLAIPGS